MSPELAPGRREESGLMPKVPQPTKTPASISPALWQNDNRKEILTFLGDYGGAYLVYEVMKNDPDPKSSEVDKANTVKVDTITNLQKAQFLAQAESMYLDKTTKTPVKRKKEAGDELEIEKAFQGDKGVASTCKRFRQEATATTTSRRGFTSCSRPSARKIMPPQSAVFLLLVPTEARNS